MLNKNKIRNAFEEFQHIIKKLSTLKLFTKVLKYFITFIRST